MFLTCCSLGLQAGNLGHDLGQGVPRVRQRGGHRLKLNYKKHQVKQTPCWPTPSRSAVSQATPSCPSASRTKPSCPEVSWTTPIRPTKSRTTSEFLRIPFPSYDVCQFLGKAMQDSVYGINICRESTLKMFILFLEISSLLF